MAHPDKAKPPGMAHPYKAKPPGIAHLDKAKPPGIAASDKRENWSRQTQRGSVQVVNRAPVRVRVVRVLAG